MSNVFLFSHGSDFAAGIIVAYAAPKRHECLKVVENNYCASKRGVFSLSLTCFLSCVNEADLNE